MFQGGSAETNLSETSRNRVLSVAYWRFFVNALLILCDMASFIAASAIIYVWQGGEALYSSRFHFHIGLWLYALACSLIWIYCLHSVGVYHRHVMGDGYQLNALLVKGTFFTGLMICAIDSILDVYIPLLHTGLVLLCAFLITMLERLIIRQFVLSSREKGAYSYGTVVVGSPEGIAQALEFLSQKRQLNYHAIAVCPIGVNERTGLVEAVVAPADFKERIRKISGRDIFMLPYCRNFAERAASMGAQTVMVTDVMQRFSDNFNTFVLNMETMNLEIAVVTSAVDVSGHETNILVSLFAVIVTAIVTVPIAIAIKLTDGGPIFYTQTRVGRRDKPFKMIKFRSMVVNADKMKAELAKETGQDGRFIFKMKDDPRVTKVGKFIRKFSIDEFPQFLNVLKGDMSVVGPRPPLPEEVAQYNQTYATRMLVKPGITGPWQVSGRSNLSKDESESLDVSYVQSWSVLGDIVLLFRTVGAVITHKGAY
ncbi:MAG: sugar transferase [Bifidobacterium sp.]|nr:sugar transferase [Bifidobacterium sp.]